MATKVKAAAQGKGDKTKEGRRKKEKEERKVDVTEVKRKEEKSAEVVAEPTKEKSQEEIEGQLVQEGSNIALSIDKMEKDIVVLNKALDKVRTKLAEARKGDENDEEVKQ